MYHEARDNHVRKDWINPPQLCGSSHHVAGLFCVRRHKSGHSTPGVEMAANTINLKSPHELLAIVPFVLGFRPAHSIVVLCLSHHRLGLTQRLDLPRPEHARQVALALMPSLIVEDPESVVLI